MKMPPQGNEEATFQMAPMIDMVFLLLVFFMCASTVSQQKNLKLDIPEAGKAQVPKERPDRWVINIDKEGNVYQGNIPFGDDIETLTANVKAKKEETPALKIYLRAAKDTPHKNVMKVIYSMATIGVESFIFGVYIPPESRTVTTTPAAP